MEASCQLHAKADLLPGTNRDIYSIGGWLSWRFGKEKNILLLPRTERSFLASSGVKTEPARTEPSWLRLKQRTRTVMLIIRYVKHCTGYYRVAVLYWAVVYRMACTDRIHHVTEFKLLKWHFKLRKITAKHGLHYQYKYLHYKYKYLH